MFAVRSVTKLESRGKGLWNSTTAARSFSSKEARKSSDLTKHRVALWDSEWERQGINQNPTTAVTIKVVGKCIEPVTLHGRHSPHSAATELAAQMSNSSWLNNILIASIDSETCTNQTWDLHRPLETDCMVTLHDFSSEVGRQTLWHSSAHLLGAALQQYVGDQLHLSDGPALDASAFDSATNRVAPGTGGFFYDFGVTGDDAVTITPDDFSAVQKLMHQMIKSKLDFTRMEVSIEFARQMFEGNPFKRDILDFLETSTQVPTISLYRCGEFIDLCRGPHVPNTKVIGKAAAKVLSCSSSRYTPPIVAGKSREAQDLQRVYGIAFPTKAELKEWETRTADAKKFNHRTIGKAQQLFMFHEYSPGSAFFLPHGNVIFQRLLTVIREEYAKRGYEEVMTPLLYSNQLWAQSGHLENYRSNMYSVIGNSDEEDSEEKHESCAIHAHSSKSNIELGSGLKPMNCPGHCLLFDASTRSYRDLPMRVADFSPLHRNELSGTLGGLTRLRRFHQDDAHIFCTMAQVESEILGCLDFIQYIYTDLFDFSFRPKLSTRPEKAIGDISQWDKAEDALKGALQASGESWEVDPGEGAFYGPKIDISVTDALGREHQCATIQLDFQLPERFELEYVTGETASEGADRARPVMIHRAVLGSVERFMAIMIEHTKGKLPFWLSPRQVAIHPISPQHLQYAEEVCQHLRDVGRTQVAGRLSGTPSVESSIVSHGVCAQVDDPTQDLRQRIKVAQRAPFNLQLIVGDQEVENGTVSFRSNDNKVNGTVTVKELVDACRGAMEMHSNSTIPPGLFSVVKSVL